MKKLSEQIADHHLEEFGDVELNVLMVKLMEEVGSRRSVWILQLVQGQY